MTQKERAVEWIIESVDGCARHWAEIIADHLIAKGAIFPPCQVGDTVYLSLPDYPKGRTFVALPIRNIIYDGQSCSYNLLSTRRVAFCDCQLNTDVFMTREEALRERDNK